MNREELREELVQLLVDMADSELRWVFNNYCEKSGYDDDFIEDMDNFDEIFQGSAWDAVRAAYYGDFRPTDNYFKFNAYGNLVSFDYIDSPESPFDADQVADYVIENDDDLDNSDIRELLDSADEFEESVRRNRRSSRRMNESIDDSFADSLIGLSYDKAIKKIENAKLYLSEYGISGGGTPAPGKTEYASFQDEDKTVELVIKYRLSKNQKYPNALTNGEIIDAYIY